MIFRPKIYFPAFSGGSPTIPPLEEVAGGYGDLSPDGIITGGEGGDTLFFNESSSVNGETGFDALWETIKLNLETPLKLIWTGGNIELEPINYRIGSSSNTFEGKPINKEIRGSAGQTIRGGSFLFEGWRNTILRNIVRKGDGLGGDFSPIHAGKGITLRYCQRFRVDHCEFDGEATIPGTELIKDGALDIARESDFITISNTYIHRCSKTTLIASSDDAIENRGKLRVTWRNCLWENNHIRQPFARFGKIHLLNNVFRYNPIYSNSADQYDWARIIEIGVESTFYTQGNKFYGHRYCFMDRDWDNPAALSGLISDGDWFDPTPHDYNRFYGIGISGYLAGSVRTSNVTWNPNTIPGYNFPLGLMTPNKAEAYVLQWAGAKYHLKNLIT